MICNQCQSTVLESDYRYQEKGFKRKGEVVKKKSILHSGINLLILYECLFNYYKILVKWFRVIIDEAHFIKSRNCSTAYAVYALDAKYRWSLTGIIIILNFYHN
jgi:DNA repair protein RAD16